MLPPSKKRKCTLPESPFYSGFEQAQKGHEKFWFADCWQMMDETRSEQ